MDKGYIGITDNDWFEFISKKSIRRVNFWRKGKSFKALNKGDLFFFLKKNKHKEKGERKVVGYGVFEKFEVLSIEESWNLYGEGNGYSNISSFRNKIEQMYNLEGQNVQIGSIILDDVIIFNNPIYLSYVDIEFANSIVSGKIISKEDVNKILNTQETQVYYNEEDENLDIGDLTILEGKEINRIIKSKERNKKARELKLKEYRDKYGKVFCEVCGECDIVALDVHHDVVQVSEMEENHETKISDLRVLCATCHRKVHGHGISVDKLRENLHGGRYKLFEEEGNYL